MDLKSLKSLISLSKWVEIQSQGEKMNQIRKVEQKGQFSICQIRMGSNQRRFEFFRAANFAH